MCWSHIGLFLLVIQSSISLKEKCAIGKPSSKKPNSLQQQFKSFPPFFGLEREQDRIEFMVVRPCNIYDA